MSLTDSQWRSIVDVSECLPTDKPLRPGRYVALDKMQAVLRKSRRSSSQNATLWMVYEQILERGGEAMQGFTKDDLHEYFLISHFGGETHELFGRKRLKPYRRSSRLTKIEFTNFLDHIVRFMAERSVVLDMPGDQETACPKCHAISRDGCVTPAACELSLPGDEKAA